MFVTMRDIRAGEKLTHDRTMTDDDESSTECRCAVADCRGTVTGKDWQLPELQRRYDNFFSAHLLEKIRNQRSRK
ncbi:MAG: hypothetical protein AVDCRST_MAG42-3329 [uncultured Chthoniobacterales bacterium]|uniref:Post-SET domain-containing protein n=1 Tax=uncultured Chthoniobacterales bacterium TaxID=1836801 RepID=A0A6J4J4S9_9BACT|nr:MAG: hypothetical protein AVDCRST_MAG42-3329 [uncultured Chthoniobacterales bacterium]